MKNIIKLIIFDLDGVLVKTKNIHYEALNIALKEISNEFVISWKDHLKLYDGLSTKNKLKILSEKKNLNPKFFNKIEKKKQEITISLLSQNIKKNDYLFNIIKQLKHKYKIAIASNAIKNTIKICLTKLGIIKLIDFIISNEEVEFAKPNPQIFLKCFVHFGVSPFEALILEDSSVGRKAAINSSAHLLPIEDINDINENIIFRSIKKIENPYLTPNKEKWISDKLNILVPMAGSGKRFSDAGFTFPKPLIEINNKPMIQVVLENINIESKYIFIAQKEHIDKYNLNLVLGLIVKNYELIPVEGVTEGAACTTLLAKHLINNDKQLIIANSDQFIEWNSNKTMYEIVESGTDGAILTFTSTHPKWSYAKLNENNLVTEVAEKKPISQNATVGIYYWKKGSDYVKYCEQMINKNIRVNDEFYVCPVYNEAIKDGKIIKTYEINRMWGLGTPEDLDIFIKKNY